MKSSEEKDICKFYGHEIEFELCENETTGEHIWCCNGCNTICPDECVYVQIQNSVSMG
ncbi:MAG: hypothetical protein ACYCSB_04165 [bacterium]